MADIADANMNKKDLAETTDLEFASSAKKDGVVAAHNSVATASPSSSIEESASSLENMALFAKWRKFQAKKKESSAQRRHTRHECSSLGVMAIINRSISMEGLVTEVSQGGVKFRPATSYLLNRNGTQVSVTFSTIRVTGKIVATRPDGYGIALFEELDDAMIDEFLRTQSELEAA